MARLLFFLSLIFIVGCDDCQKYANNEFRAKHNNFTITNKYLSKSRFVNLTGVGLDNKPDTFTEVGYYDLLDSAKIGDVLLKESGKTEVFLIRKDSVRLLFPCICDGVIIK